MRQDAPEALETAPGREIAPAEVRGFAPCFELPGADVATLVAKDSGSRMNQSDNLTVFLAVLPVIGTIAGFWINHIFESQRQATQRKNDRTDRRRATRRALLEQLQYALADIKDGVGLSALLLLVDKDRSAEAAKAVINEPWFRDWQNAARRVAILAAQLDDEELKQAAKAVGVNYEFMQAIDKGDRQALQDATEKLDCSAMVPARDSKTPTSATLARHPRRRLLTARVRNCCRPRVVSRDRTPGLAVCQQCPHAMQGNRT